MDRMLRLFPRAWRAAYGSEVTEMLARSERPWRDRADLVRAAAAVRGHQLVDPLLERTDGMRYQLVAGLGLVVLGVAGGFWVTPQLAHGIVELPQHWWSTLAVLPGVLGLGLAAVAATVAANRTRARRRAR